MPLKRTVKHDYHKSFIDSTKNQHEIVNTLSIMFPKKETKTKKKSHKKKTTKEQNKQTNKHNNSTTK